MNSDTKAIIGGSVAGGLVLLVLLGLYIFFTWTKKKKEKKRRENLKRLPGYPAVSPPTSLHSNQSSLQSRKPTNLPKVNSTGLWLGAPGIYSNGPAPAYTILARPGAQPVKPGLLPRAASEQRIPQPVPAHGPRIYHSQQLAPVFEVPASSEMEIYGVYQYPGGPSRSKMVETKHSQFYYAPDMRPVHMVKRSSSDAQDKKKPKPRQKSPGRDKRQGRASKESSLRSNVSRGPGGKIVINHVIHDPRVHDPRVHDPRRSSISSSRGVNRPSDPSRNQQQFVSSKNNLVSRSNSKVNRGYTPDTGELIRVPADPAVARSQSSVTSSQQQVVSSPTVKPQLTDGLNSSATDSMKLLAKNKTDDQKTNIPIIVDNSEVEKDLETKHYLYNEDIYAVSTKARLQDDDNPIISRMKEMATEKLRSSKPSPRNNMASQDSESPYAEIKSLVNGQLNEEQQSSARTLKVRDVIVSREPSPAIDENRLAVSDVASPLSSDGEGGSEDLSKAGKRITESAFTFLDTYSSDEESTDIHIDSLPVSQTPRAQAVAD